MSEPINIKLYNKKRDWRECWTEDSEIRKYFEEETNNFIHWTENRDKIYYWYNNLPQNEKSLIKEIIFREAKNGKNDLMAKSQGCASLIEGICLKEKLPTTYINHDGILVMRYNHNHDYREAWFGNPEDDHVLHKEYLDFGKDGNFDFFVNCDPEFLEYVYNDDEFDYYIEKYFYDEKDKTKFWYSINDDIEFLNWLKKKKEDFYYAVRLKIFLEEINCNSKLIEFIRSDNDFYNYKVEYLTYNINKSKEFFNWLLWKKQIFDLIKIRLDKFNKNGEIDMKSLQLIIDLNFQTLKELLLNLKKFYPHLFRRWIFNWRKFRLERNPLRYPSLENIDDISGKLFFLENDAIFKSINKIIAAKNYLTLITNQTSNLDIQEMDKFILNSNLFSKPVIIYKDNEIVFYNIKDDGSIEPFYFRKKKIVKLFKEHKKDILPYLEEAIKEKNFISFLTSLQIKLQSIRWWQNKKQEIVNFFPNCYSYLRYSLIKKHKFTNSFLIDEINAKNASNFYIFLDKNLDKNFNEMYIYLKELKRIHPEFFRTPFSILNINLNVSNMGDLEAYISKFSLRINDNISAKLLNEILMCINYIKQNVSYLKKLSCNKLNNNDLKNLLKLILPGDIVDKLNEVKNELFLKFDIKENEIDYFQFTMNFATFDEFNQCNFVNYLKIITCIDEFDKEYILHLFNAKSPEKFKIFFNNFSIKIENSYNNYFEKNYKEINKKNSNYSNQINDMKNFIEQVNKFDDNLKKDLSLSDDKIKIKEISSQISSTESYFADLLNELSQPRNTFENLSCMRKKIEEGKNEFQTISSKVENLKNQLQINYCLIEENIKSLLRKINELEQSLQKVKKKLNDNKEQNKENENNIKLTKELMQAYNEKITQLNNSKENLGNYLNENSNFNFKLKSIFLNNNTLLNKFFKNNEKWQNLLEEIKEKQNEITEFKNCQCEASEECDFFENVKKCTEEKLFSFQKESDKISNKNKELLKQKSEIENKINSYTAKFKELNDFTNRKEFSDFRDFVKTIPTLDSNSKFRTTVQL